MNRTEVERLAGMANKLRPDWAWSSLCTFIDTHLKDRAYRDAAVALADVACAAEPTTPTRVLEAGPWWHVGAASSATTESGIVTRCEHGEPGARCLECYPRGGGVGMTDEQRAAIRAAAAAGREHVKALEREA